MLKRAISFVFAIAAMAGVLLFGGLLLPGKAGSAHMKTVELLSEDMEKTEEKIDQPEPEQPPEEIEAPKEQPPDAAEVNTVVRASDATPALDAVSLSAIASMLNPGGSGGDDFGGSASLASGGRIGGTGRPGGAGGGDDMDKAFGMDDIDQKPRIIVQTPPAYPSELKGRKMQGVVQVAFIVTTAGRVASARVETSSHPAFDAPALAAIRQWKFEPAVRGGARAQCRMRISIKFQAG